MSQITAKLIKELRDRTGVGMSKCKEALVKTNGDLEEAVSELRKSGMASAVKREGREANEGVIIVTSNDNHIALVEVNAETDFVVKNEKFQAFAQSLATELLATLPANLEEFMSQTSSQDAAHTLDELRAELVGSLGENIQVRRVEHFEKKSGASISTYTHAGGKLVTLVEINGGEDQETLARDIAMHVAAEAPEYLSSKEVPERVIAHEREIALAQIADKPPQIQEKIVEGKLRAYFDQVCLLNQKYVRDPKVTIESLLKQQGKELTIQQFLRWKVGA